MTEESRLLAPFRKALERLDPALLVREALGREPWSRGEERIALASIGKSAARMAAGATELPIAHALVVTTPEEAIRGRSRLPKEWAVRAGDHPVPSRRSFAAGRELETFFGHAPDEPMLALISGGGSALVEVPRPPLLESDFVLLAEALVAAGRPIAEMNAVRRRISRLKGGGVLKLRKGRVLSLVISDVSTGGIETVSSGPTLPPPGSEPDVSRLLAALPDLAGLDSSGKERFESALAQPGAVGPFPRHDARLLGSASDLARTVAEELEQVGVPVERIADNLDATAGEFSQALVEAALSSSNPARALILGGEPTLAVPAGSPPGGRAAHVALEAAVRLSECAACPPVAILAAASDGIDGTGDAGGAAISPRLVEAIRADPEPARRALRAFDATGWLGQRGALLPASESGLNLRDVFVVAPGSLL